MLSSTSAPRYDLQRNPPYQINYRSKRAGKHITATKRRITFQFGFSSAEAITHVESRGNPLARNACCSGLMQVSRRYARVPEPLLYVPAINRLEGWRILTRWRRRCGGRLECALRAYATGNRALRDAAHGRPYALAVLRRMR